MRRVNKTTQVSRRLFLKTSSLTAFGGIALGGGATLLDPKGAWAMTLKCLSPQTMATLILMARDIYPHDRLTDATYAKAVAGYDDQAASDPALKKLITEGCANLDKSARAAWAVDYVNVGWEEQRDQLLRQIEQTAFFQTIRSGLITSLYDQHDIWMKFGYEGSSAEKGGYLHRGFNDIDWLPAQPAQEVQS
jgi:hypothetical protein